MADCLADSRIEIAVAHLRESAAVKLRTVENVVGSVVAAAGLIAAAFQRGGKLLFRRYWTRFVERAWRMTRCRNSIRSGPCGSI